MVKIAVVLRAACDYEINPGTYVGLPRINSSRIYGIIQGSVGRDNEKQSIRTGGDQTDDRTY
jgi:hypothetical protein